MFWEFAERKLATRKAKIKIIKTKRDGYVTCLPLALSVSREERREVLLAILNGTSNPVDLHNEHSLFQRISIHLYYDVKTSKHLASLLTTDNESGKQVA
jgi:hypothetical protein